MTNSFMKLLLLSGAAAFALHSAQAAYDPTADAWTDGLPALSASQLTAAFAKRQPINGDISGQHVLPTGAVNARTMADKLRDLLTPADFLAAEQTEAQLVSGVIDAGPAFSAAMLNSISSPSSTAIGAAVVIPCGFYRFDTKPTFPTSGYFQSALRGISSACVTFEINYQIAPGDALLAYYAQSYLDIEDITFSSLVAQTAGAALQFRQTFGTTLRNLVFTGSAGKTLFDNLVLDGANTTVANNIQARPFTGTDGCILLLGTVVQTADFTLSGSGINGCNRGLVANNSSGVYISDTDMTGGVSSGVSIRPSSGGALTGSIAGNVLTVTAAPTGKLDVGTVLTGTGVTAGTAIIARGSGAGGTGTYTLNTAQTVPSGSITAVAQNVNAFFAQNLLTDTTSNGNGFEVVGDGAVTELHLTKLWAGGSGATATPGTFNGPYAGLILNNPNLDGAQLEHVYAHGNGGIGIDIEAGKHISLSDPQACMNGQATNNTYPGIVVAAPVDYFQISSPFAGACGYFSKVAGQTNKQSYGLTINNNASQHITMLGGQFDGNVTSTWTHFAASADVNFISAATPP